MTGSVPLIEVLGDSVAGKSYQFGDSTDGQFVGRELHELNDICFAEHDFRTMTQTSSPCSCFYKH